jgi:hypothetical protein
MFSAVDRELIYMVITVGTVVDTNDPQQEGRVRVQVPAYGDRDYAETSDLPWAMMASPFMGMVQNSDASRGAETTFNTDGQVAYGFWNTPKVGSSVLITCINGDPMSRVCLGCIPVQTTSHTIPGGRYFYDTSQLAAHGEPEGPLSSREKPIQPLYDNQSSAFGSRTDNYEYRTRGAEHQVAGIDSDTIATYSLDIDSQVADDNGFRFTQGDGVVFTSIQGYDRSRVTSQSVNDSNVYAWVTPGFHAISMDDSSTNCRMRFRTTSGAQIILDDTNERIYISTAKGNNWFEMDQDGNVYAYARSLSWNVDNDINFTAGGTIRMFAHVNFSVVSEGDIRLQSADDFHIGSGGSIRSGAVGNYYVQGSEVNIVGNTLFISSQMNLNLMAIAGEILATGTTIQLNGPPAMAGDVSNVQPAFWSNIVPQHEPWGRMTTLDDFSHQPVFDYNDPQVGRQFTIRGTNWRR